MKCCSCSKGCELEIERVGLNQLKVSGGACHRGEVYALKMLELEAVKGGSGFYKGHVPVENGYMSHVMVTSEREISKEWFSEIDRCLKVIVLSAPIVKGQVVYESIENPEIRVVAARGMKQRKE